MKEEKWPKKVSIDGKAREKTKKSGEDPDDSPLDSSSSSSSSESEDDHSQDRSRHKDASSVSSHCINLVRMRNGSEN